MSNFTITDIGQDTLDVRDIIERIEELQAETEGEPITEHLEAEREELTKLLAIMEEIKGCGGDEQWKGDWYPLTLIHENHFEDAMDELLEDIGDLPKDLPSYLKITVDYDALRMDYTGATLEGEYYLMR